MNPHDFAKRNPGFITRDQVVNQPDRSGRGLSSEQKSPFISTGLQSVDDAMRGGFARECMTLIASRPRVGATSLLIGSVLAALNKRLKVAYYSDRLNQRQLRGRLILRASEVNGYRIQAGLMTDKEVVLMGFNYDVELLDFAADSLKKDKEFILELVKIDGYALEFADDSLKNDSDILKVVNKNK